MAAASGSGVASPNGGARSSQQPASSLQKQPGGASSPGATTHVPSTGGRGRVTGDDIFAAVDNEAPPEQAAKPTPGKQPTQKPQKAKTPADQRAADAEQAQAPSDAVGLDAIINGLTSSLKEGKPQQKPNGDLDPALLTDEQGNPLSEREVTRMQFLANKAKGAEQRAAHAETAIQEMTSRFDQLQAGLGERLLQVSQQNAHLRGRLESLLSGQQQQQLSPDEQIEQDLINKASTATERKMAKTIQALTQRLDAHDQRTQQAEKTRQVQQNKARYLQDSDRAARSVVLAGLDEADMGELFPLAQEMVLGKAWAKNTSAEQAAKMVRDDFLRMSLAFVKAQAKMLKQKKAQSDDAPSTPSAQRGVGQGEAEPTYHELRAAGYRGPNPFMDWDLAGRPALRRG